MKILSSYSMIIKQNNILKYFCFKIRVITKSPNTEQQSSKGKGKTHKHKQTTSVNNWKTGKTAMALTWYRHFQKTVGWIRFYGVKHPAFITVKRFLLSLEQHFYIFRSCPHNVFVSSLRKNEAAQLILHLFDM